MKLVTFNINGIRARMPRLLEYLERSRERQPLVYQQVAQAWRRTRRRHREPDPDIDPEPTERPQFPTRQAADR